MSVPWTTHVRHQRPNTKVWGSILSRVANVDWMIEWVRITPEFISFWFYSHSKKDSHGLWISWVKFCCEYLSWSYFLPYWEPTMQHVHRTIIRWWFKSRAADWGQCDMTVLSRLRFPRQHCPWLVRGHTHEQHFTLIRQSRRQKGLLSTIVTWYRYSHSSRCQWLSLSEQLSLIHTVKWLNLLFIQK